MEMGKNSRRGPDPELLQYLKVQYGRRNEQKVR